MKREKRKEIKRTHLIRVRVSNYVVEPTTRCHILSIRYVYKYIKTFIYVYAYEIYMYVHMHVYIYIHICECSTNYATCQIPILIYRLMQV